MAVDEDTDTESVSGDYLDLGDIHTPTNGDGEFYECEDDEMDEEYFDAQDSQDNELPSLVQRDSKEKNFPPPLDNYIPNDPSSHPRNLIQ